MAVFENPKMGNWYNLSSMQYISLYISDSDIFSEIVFETLLCSKNVTSKYCFLHSVKQLFKEFQTIGLISQLNVSRSHLDWFGGRQSRLLSIILLKTCGTNPKGLQKLSQIGICYGFHIITLDILHIKRCGIFPSTWGCWNIVDLEMFDSLIFFILKIYFLWTTSFLMHLVSWNQSALWFLSNGWGVSQ